MEAYYIAFKEKHVIHVEAQFHAESFKTACPDIYYQIGMCDWGSFTIPVDPYFPELQATTLSFPNLRSMLRMWAACPFVPLLDKTVQADSVITLATKTDKDDPVMKREKYPGNRTPPHLRYPLTHQPLHSIQLIYRVPYLLSF
ncbi:hypothetical protein HAX54_001438 [Datura stramonium]|uniref:Uncharacterized protein n=1 Tax=Datura stramonium TaxID=4076 RepID=A0ABS8T2D0_DATST|nr:hypothetical protein [Datura stramonium]